MGDENRKTISTSPRNNEFVHHTQSDSPLEDELMSDWFSL